MITVLALQLSQKILDDYRRLTPCRSFMCVGDYCVDRRGQVKWNLGVEVPLKSFEFRLNVLRNALNVLRKHLKMYETGGTGDECLGEKLVKIDGDSGAAVSLVPCVPVLASSASRAKHNCTTL